MEETKFERWLLIPWPYYQSLQEEPGFSKHSLFVPSHSDVCDPCFVEESWYLGVQESHQFDKL